jgi:hypothetical protein
VTNPTEIRITMRCTKEPDKHAKILRLNGDLGMAWAERLAALIDGSSVFYIHGPGPNSPIGKCDICGAKLETETREVEISGQRRPQEQVRDSMRLVSKRPESNHAKHEG